MLGENPHAEGGRELHHDGARDVLDAEKEPHRQAREQIAGNHTTDDGQQRDRYDGGEVQPTRCNCEHSGAIDQQRARIVQQALVLKYHEQAVRQPQLFQNRAGCRAVRRRDDRAECNRGCPRHTRH